MDPEEFHSKNRRRSPRTKRVKVRKRIEGEEDQFGRQRLRRRTKRALCAWVILIAVVSLLAVWGFQTIRKHFLASSEPPPRAVVPVVEKAPPLLDGPGNWKGMVPADVARGFMQARSVGERLRLVRHPVEVVDIMKRFYSDGPGRREKPVDLAPMEDVSSDGKIVTRFVMKMEDGSMRLVSIPFTEDGLARVDFKAYARYCSHPWSDVLSGKATSAPEMRVFLTGGTYYNLLFADEARWMSFVASSPDLDQPIFLYADRGDPSLPVELRDWSANPGTPPVRCTLSLETLGGSYQSRQFVLKKLLYVGWVDPG